MFYKEYSGFSHALPVWERGKSTEMNHTLAFRAVTDKKSGVLKIACSGAYRLTVNSTFVASGPARAGHGFFRVDEIRLDEYLTHDMNTVAIIAAGYAVNSFEYPDQRSFLCAELECDGMTVCATGAEDTDGFECTEYTQKLKKAQRYSFQRTFAEVYDYKEGYDSFLTDPWYYCRSVELELVKYGKFLPRCVYYPTYKTDKAQRIVNVGTVGISEKESYYTDRSIVNITPIFKGYKPEELGFFSTTEYGRLDFYSKAQGSFDGCDAPLVDSSYAVFDMGRELTGFCELEIECEGDVTLYAAFDEILTDGDVDPYRMKCCNIVVWRLKKGSYKLFTIEPYSYRYIKFALIGADAYLRDVTLRRYEFNENEITSKKPDGLDDDLDKIYDAAVATFCQNTLDVYMDCPSRERAGWLCDSFFTSRVEYALTGKTTVERCFLENFILPEKFEHIPDGMLPMCYPADHTDKVYIPNWAMWFVIELEEYLRRSGDRQLIDAAKDRVYALLDFLRTFENSDGLLSKLESWVFIEWSESNKLVQDISYPSNMLYSKFKRTIARLYSDERLMKESDDLAEVIRNSSFTGSFFCDNSVYDESGEPVLSGKCTESCQYYAFFSEVATPETYPELWDTLVNDFGPERKETQKWSWVSFANAFIGNYLRLELLYKNGLYDKVQENIRGYFKKMADETGTLWENDTSHASCNHGFASHVIYWMNKMGE